MPLSPKFETAKMPLSPKFRVYSSFFCLPVSTFHGATTFRGATPVGASAENDAPRLRRTEDRVIFSVATHFLQILLKKFSNFISLKYSEI